MNSEPAPATMRNHGEIDTPTAMPPAIVRSTKPHATAAEIEHRLVLEPHAVRDGEHEVAADHERELPTRGERQRDRGGREHDARR